MATMRLVPSSYTLQSSSYFSVSNATNAYTNVDSTTYATFQTSSSSTSNRYFYLKGFNISDIPSNAVVSDFTVKLRGYETGGSTSTSYAPTLCNGTTALSGTTASTNIGTSVRTITIPTGSLDWSDIVNYGENLSIRVNARRASRNTASYYYIYGAEIEVTYTVPDPATVTSTLSGNGTISPSGAYSTYEGAEYELTITPTNKSDAVTVTKNGVDVTSQLVAHGAGSTVNLAPADVTTSGISSGSSYAEYAVGHTAESPSSSGTSSNMYASSGSTGYAAYSFDFSGIPSGAVIESISAKCYGHRENNNIDSSHVSQVVIYNGSDAISDEVDFPSTSNSLISVEATQDVTRAQLDNVRLRHYVGYYGGLILGITMTVVYSTGSGLDHYTYTYIVDGDATIVVTIGASAKLMYKNSGAWVAATKVYKKVGGSWVEQADLSNVFDSNTNYVKG